jgi:hypothetical protein
MVKYYYNFYNDDGLENNDRLENNNRLENNYRLENESVKNAVTGKYKGYGEAMILLNALNIINNLNNQYKYIYKLSGRYYLNDNFDINIFENNQNIFTHWDDCKFSLCTVFYKIIYNERQYFQNVLKKSIRDLISSPNLINNIFGNSLGFAAGYLTKKVAIGSSHNPLKQIMGAILQLGVSNVVAKNAGGIKSVAVGLLRNYLSRRKVNDYYQ